MNLQEKLRELHQARLLAATEASALKVAEQAFRSENVYLYNARTISAECVSDLEAEIREIAVKLYQADSTTKDICPGVGIRVRTVYQYDAGKALGWAKEHGLCLTLDGKAFDGLCKAEASRPDFVAVSELPTATIAIDLAKVLES